MEETVSLRKKRKNLEECSALKMESSSASSFECFLLNQIPNPTILWDQHSVQLVNFLFENEIRYPPQMLLGTRSLPFLEDDTSFISYVEECRISCLPCTHDAILQTGETMDVLFTPHSSGKVLCIFRKKNDSINLEKLKWFDFVAKFTPALWCVSEFYQEYDDIKHVFVNSSLSDLFHSLGVNRSKLVGHFRRKYFSRIQQFDFLLEQIKDIYNKGVPSVRQFEFEWTSPNEEQVFFLVTICYLGISNNNGRPQFLSFLENITYKTKLGRELAEKEREVEKVRKLSSSYQMFYDHSPILMGTAEVIDNGRDIQTLYCNPISCQLFSKSNTVKNPLQASELFVFFEDIERFPLDIMLSPFILRFLLSSSENC